MGEESQEHRRVVEDNRSDAIDPRETVKRDVQNIPAEQLPAALVESRLEIVRLRRMLEAMIYATGQRVCVVESYFATGRAEDVPAGFGLVICGGPDELAFGEEVSKLVIQGVHEMTGIPLKVNGVRPVT